MPPSDLAANVTTLCGCAFDQATVQRGLDYHAQGRVLSSNALLHQDDLHLHATVRGRQSYLVEVHLIRRRENVNIEAVCTCPSGVNCKHAVAAIADIFGKDGMKLFATDSHRIPPEDPEALVEIPPDPLPSPFVGWLASLRAAPAQAAPARPPQKTILYRLDLSSYRGLEVHILQASPLKSGALGKASPWRSQQLDEDSPYPPEDLGILRELAGMSYRAASYALRGAFGRRMLQRLIATGKCHWKTVRHDAPLKPGPLRTATLDWATAPDGTQTPTLALQPPADTVVALDPPIYLDTATGECGGIESPHASAVIRQWLAAPPVAPRESRAVAAQVRTLGLPAPREITVVERNHVPFTPVLKLMHVRLQRALYCWSGRYRNQSISELDVARLEFDYAGHRARFSGADEPLEAFQDGRVESIRRHLRQEERADDQFCATGLMPLDELYGYDLPEENQDDFAMPSPEYWRHFMNDVVPDLRQRGWKIEIEPGFRYQFATVQDWYSKTAADTTANDWFSFELGILVDGQRHNLLPLIRGVLDQLQRLESAAQLPAVIDLQLPDDRFVQLPAQRVLDIAKTLAELHDPAALVEGRLEISRLRAAELVDLPGLGQWKGAAELRTLARRLASYQGIARLPPPAGLKGTLRPYQLDGLSWLQFLREYAFGGILADDMGLGETVQVLAHLVLEKESGRANLPSLVVAPTSLMANWRAETRRFAPGLRVHVSHGGDRKEHFERLADFDLIVTSYSLLPRDEEILKGQPFHLLILDEAQYVKNPNTKWADVARAYRPATACA